MYLYSAHKEKKEGNTYHIWLGPRRFDHRNRFLRRTACIEITRIDD